MSAVELTIKSKPWLCSVRDCHTHGEYYLRRPKPGVPGCGPIIANLCLRHAKDLEQTGDIEVWPHAKFTYVVIYPTA